MKTTPNSYRDLSRGDLNTAANHRAGELMNPTGTRSKEERAALALDTAHLLLALVLHVSPKEHTPASPQYEVRSGGMGLRDAFAKEHSKMLRSARYYTFMQAADVTLGGGVPNSIASDVVGKELYDAAMQSEAGLLSALEQMQATYEARQLKKKQ